MSVFDHVKRRSVEKLIIKGLHTVKFRNKMILKSLWVVREKSSQNNRSLQNKIAEFKRVVNTANPDVVAMANVNSV